MEHRHRRDLIKKMNHYNSMMITIQKLTETYLTCALCSEEFKDPGTLDCNHSFCKQCILEYAKNEPEVSKSLPCPVCQEPTKVASPDTPLQEWVNQMAITESISNLINTLGPAIGACCVCLAPRETTPTTIWCSVCSSLFCDSCGAYHNKMPQSRQHKVSTYDTVTTDTTKTIKCPTHSDDNIYQFCKDCIAAICLKCKIIHHRKCKDVFIIEDTVPEYTSLYQRLTEGTEEEKNAGYVSRNQAPSDVLELGARIQVTCRDSVSLVREKELTLLRKVIDMRGDHSKLLDSEIDSDESIQRDLEEQVKGIDDALTSGSMKTLFEVFESTSRHISSGNNSIEESENEKLRVPRFIPTGKDFGKTTSEIELRKSLPIPENLSNRNAVLHDYYDVRHSQDRVPPCLVDVVVMETNGVKRIVVTDERNKNIKLVHKEGSRQFLTTVTLDESPIGVTKHGEGRVLITVPSLRKIQEFSINPALSKTPKEIKTKHKYRGICHLREDHLAVAHNHSSFFNQPSVDIINTRGEILLTFKSRSIPNPQFLCSLSNDQFLVSNSKPGSVSLISERKKECIFTYKPKRPKGKSLSGREVLSPRGLATNLKGDFFIVDCGTNRVVQLAKSGEFKKQLLTSTDGINNPSGICAIETDDVEEFLYVTTQQFVKVFKLK